TRKEEDEIFHAMFSGNGCRTRDGSGRVNPRMLQLSIQRSEKGRSEQLHGKNRGGIDRILWGMWFRGRERCAWRKPRPDRRGKRPCESAMPYAVDEHLA